MMETSTSIALTWNTTDTPEELHTPLRTLSDAYPLSEGGEGSTALEFRKSDICGSLHVRFDGHTATVTYGSVPAALRGVAKALATQEADERTTFTTYGIMLDCSRNAVMSVPHLRKWLRQLALMGYNMVMLYTEDTYQLPDEPYFGYMRGAYTAEEIRELDAYAAALGMEMTACIQTLGHMEQALKWDSYSEIRDTENILLVDEEKTYRLIDKMIAFWSDTLSTDRIHVGMEVVQIRFAAQITRYEETAERIQEFLDGEIDTIAELDVNINASGRPVMFFDWLMTGSTRI